MVLFVSLSPDREGGKPQLLLFSATVPVWVQETADRYMSDDRVIVDLIGRQSLRTAITVEHKAISCPYSERPSTIADVIQVRLMIFTYCNIAASDNCLKISFFMS